MQHLRTIEIDFDIHKLIEGERRSFDETPNDALRRLLKLPDNAPTVAKRDFTPRRDWSDKGVVLPHGTAIRMEYSGKAHFGHIRDGVWVIDDQIFDSPSGAASGVAITRKGNQTKLDGWKYWYVKRPRDTGWTPISDLRKKPVVLDASTLTDEDFQ